MRNSILLLGVLIFFKHHVSVAQRVAEIDLLYQTRIELSNSKNTNDSFVFLDSIVANHKIIHIGTPSHIDGNPIKVATSIVKYLHEKHHFNVVVLEEGFSMAWAITDAIKNDTISNPLEKYSGGSWFVCNRENNSRWNYFSEHILSDSMMVFGTDLSGYNDKVNDFILNKIFSLCESLKIEQSKYDILFRAIRRASDSYSPALIEEENQGISLIAEIRSSIDYNKYETEANLVIHSIENYFSQINWASSKNIKGKGNHRKFVKIMSYRDSVMATNFEWVQKQIPKDSKIILLTTNYHAIKNTNTEKSAFAREIGSVKFMGDYISQKSKVFSIAIVSGDTKFYDDNKHLTRYGIQWIKRKRIKAESLEFALIRKGSSYSFLNLRECKTDVKFFMRPTFIHFIKTDWNKNYDGILFISKSEHVILD